MGIVSEVLSTDGVDVKVDRGSNDNIQAKHFTSPGEDSHPLPGDYAALSQAGGTGRQTAVGYLDGKNDPQAAPGEKRIYSRDASGSIVAELWLKNTGEILLKNLNAVIRVDPAGEVNINGAIITPDGEITSASGVSLDNHTHAQGNDSSGDTEQETEPPTNAI
ncbi:MAG: hypothetical protein RR182_01045 [Alistipes sp.]